ncbi:MAG: helix-turn-helix domain-containing protein [Lachnospiraceae bacterium]|nr:helix-turn-helix domain-containing protein [Lachnospiraceae bacterium]
MKERLKKIRKSLDLTQQEFADRIGIKRNSYANYEIGRNIPIDAIILSICREFNVNEDWLRNGGSDENMFIKLTEDEELAMYTQMLLDSTDDIMADMIKDFIVVYEKLDNDSKQVLKNFAKSLLDKANSK